MKKALVSFSFKLAAVAVAVASPFAVHAAPEEVNYLLPAPPTLPAFAPWMIAQQRGYYADENIKVNFVLGKGGVDVAKQIGAGNAVIGGAIGDTPIIVRANGVPVKAVAVLGAGSLSALAVKKDGPIKSVADLKGKTLTVISYSDTTYYALLGTLKKYNLSKNDVSIQAAGPAGVWQLFAAGKSEGMAATPDWLVDADEATNGNVDYLKIDKPFNSMAQAIIASDETIKKNPDLIKRLVRATLRGMQDVMKDPKSAAATYAQAAPAFKGKEEKLERILRLYNKYVYADQKVLGQMDTARLAEVQKFYVSEGIVSKAAPLTDLYTNQFVGVER